jgi:DNA polymerase-3 subunit delta
VFYIRHGENELERDESVAKLRQELATGDAAMVELNTTVFDGSRLTMGELRHACDTIPFMTECRLVIVHGLLTRLASGRKREEQEGAAEQDPAWKRTFREDLAEYLPKLPPTTQLIFVEPKEVKKKDDPLLKAAQAQKVEAKKEEAPPEQQEKEEIWKPVRVFLLPKEDELVGWIQKRVRDRKGKMSGSAADLLARLIGRDLRLLDQEIDKLLTYVDGKRPVNVEDVQTLVSHARVETIFELVDRVGQHQTARALELLHFLLEQGEHPLQILIMLGRQVRILIQVSELRKEGLVPPEIASRLGLAPWMVDKFIKQAQKFDMAQLKAAHRRLVETDWAIKTGKMEETLALDLLVVGLGQGATA